MTHPMTDAQAETHVPAKIDGARPRRRIGRIILISVAVLVVGGLIYGIIWIQPYQPSAEATAALQSDSVVTVTNGDDDIAFMPKATPKLGLIFYPGAKVEPAAYAVTMHALAAQGYATFIAKMPLNIALLNEDAASPIISAHPAITRWVIGGHSLGGVHAYFGDYGPQDGDGTPTITRAAARQQILAATEGWLATLAAPVPAYWVPMGLGARA